MTPAADATHSQRPAGRWEVFAWTMYDWSSSAYSTLLITVVMMYITTVLVPGKAGPTVYAWTISASMLLAALLSPVLGAVADAAASKRRWLAATAFVGAGAMASLWLVPYQWNWLAVGILFVSSLCFELSLTFYNGFLPEITDDETINRVSGYGFAMGYIGGALALVLAIAVLQNGERLGLPSGNKLTMDFVATRDAEFAVDLPPGEYEVRVRLGDPARPRGPTRVFVGSSLAGEVSTQPGESKVVSQSVRLDSPPLRVRVAGVASGTGGEAAVQALEIEGHDGAGHAVVLRFDFGTLGSYAEPGYLWLTDQDRFRTWNRDELIERGLPDELPDARRLPAAATTAKTSSEGQDGADGLPLQLPGENGLAFGWQRGEVRSYDAVLPPRLQYGLLILGLWWGVFSIPTVAILRDRGRPPDVAPSTRQAVSDAVRKVGQTLRSVRKYRTLFIFLVAFLFFNDGIQTVINQASVFAKQELGFVLGDLIALILMVQILALPGALIVGYVADHLGRKPTLMLCLGIWVALVLSAYFVTTKTQFWIMGAVLAMVMGGTQAVARAIMGVMTPQAHSAEFFGFYNFSGKATSWMGSALFGLVIYVTGSARIAIVSVLVFFLVGWLLVAVIDVARGQREAQIS